MKLLSSLKRKRPLVVIESARDTKIRRIKNLASCIAVLGLLAGGTYYLFIATSNDSDSKANKVLASIKGDVQNIEPGLGNNPDVLWVGTFDTQGDWKQKWGISQIGTYINQNEAIAVTNAPEKLDGNALRVTVPGSNDQKSRWGIDIRTDFKKMGIDPREEAYFRYYIYLPDDFECVEGGKIPGLSGITEGDAGHSTSSGGEYSERSWSGRLYWKQDVGDKGCGLVSYMYVKHANGKEISKKDGRYVGLSPRWNNNAKSSDGYTAIKKGEWNAIEVYYKMNTPGKNDGLHKGWVNGQLGINLNDVQYRTADHPDLKINQIFSSIFYGGPKGPLKTQSLYFDNYVVSESYVGPRNTNAGPITEPTTPDQPGGVVDEDPTPSEPATNTPADISFGGHDLNNLSGSVKIQAIPVSDKTIEKIDLYIDNKLINTEKDAPYYLGGDNNGNARGYDTKALSNGAHELKAIMTYDSGKTIQKIVSVRVANGQSSVSVQGASNGAVVSGVIYVNATPQNTTSVSKVDFYIDNTLFNSESDAPYYLGGDNNGNARGYDTKKLTNGQHTLRTVLTYDGSKTVETSLVFNVNNPVVTNDNQTIQAEKGTCKNSCSTRSESKTTDGKALVLNRTGSRISYTFKVPKTGTYRIGGTLKSQDYNGKANVAVYLNGKKVTTKTANSTSFADIDLDNRAFSGDSMQTIEFEFTNDLHDGSGKDRNLLVDTLYLRKQ